jgi:hypothetical protein
MKPVPPARRNFFPTTFPAEFSVGGNGAAEDTPLEGLFHLQVFPSVDLSPRLR